MKMVLMIMMSAITFGAPNEKEMSELLKTAKGFVTLVDVNDATQLEKILHPEMMQFAKIGDKLMPFKRNDFVEMVAAKKLGGKSRVITLKSVQMIRENTADVILQAVSEEYDFVYQISLAKEDGKWLIVTVLSEIEPVKS